MKWDMSRLGFKSREEWIEKEKEFILYNILGIKGITDEEFQNLCNALIPILKQVEMQNRPLKFKLLGFNIEHKGITQ